MQIIFGLFAHFLAAKTSPPYMHTARRKKRSFTGNSARTSNHFSVMFFRKTRKMSADVQAYFKRNLTPYSGNSAPNLKSFFGDVFSQDKENERRRTSVLQAKFDAVFGKLIPETSNHFSVMFFRKTRKMSADVQAYFKRNLTQYSGNSARTSAHFSVMFFSQDKENKRWRTVGTPSEI